MMELGNGAKESEAAGVDSYTFHALQHPEPDKARHSGHSRGALGFRWSNRRDKWGCVITWVMLENQT